MKLSRGKWLTLAFLVGLVLGCSVPAVHTETVSNKLFAVEHIQGKSHES